MDLKVENAILWQLVKYADECGVDFGPIISTVYDAHAEETEEMDYWSTILTLAGYYYGLLGDHSDTENMP